MGIITDQSLSTVLIISILSILLAAMGFGIGLLVFVVIALSAVIWAWSPRQTSSRLVVLAVFLTTVLCVFGRLYLLGVSTLSPDELWYAQWGQYVANHLQNGAIPVVDQQLRYVTAIYVFSLVYFFAGDSGIVVTMTINAGLFSLSVVYWLHVVRIAFDNHLSRHGTDLTGRAFLIAGVFFFLYPGRAFLGATHQREPFVFLLLSYTVFRMMLYYTGRERSTVLTILTAGVPIVLLIYIRPEIGLVLLVAIGAVEVLTGPWWYFIVPATGAAGAGTFVNVLGLPIPRQLSIFVSRGVLSRLNGLNARVLEATYRGREGWAYPGSLKFSSWLDLLFSFPERAFYFMVYPFPWNVSHYVEYLTGQQSTITFFWRTLDTTYMSAIILLGVACAVKTTSANDVRNLFENRAIIFLCVCLALIVAGYSLTIPGITNFRRRLYVVPFVITFSAPALSEWSRNVKVIISDEEVSR